MTNISIEDIFMDTVKFSKSVSSFFGLINSLNKKLKDTAKNELNTALDLLFEQESNDTIDQLILRKARLNFNKALYLETNKDRLIVSYIGLALCHIYLNDKENYKYILSRLINSDLLKTNYLFKIVNSKKYHIYNLIRKQIEQCLKS